VSAFNGFELANAFRLAEFRRLLEADDGERFIDQYHQDITEERIVEYPCNLGEVLKRAQQLSAKHTLTGGHRGFDILHVAAALEMGADILLTFDRNQSRLATAEKLNAPLNAGKR
jgi:predicted nucleic acid-binding protein